MNINKKRIKSGVEKYQKIMRLYRYRRLDDKKRKKFQKTYKGFYKVIRKRPSWYSCYFGMLEDLKKKNIPFGDALVKFTMKIKIKRVEKSFISKMIHTRNPRRPIIDKWVLRYFKKQMPKTYSKDKTTKAKVEKAIEQYNGLVECYKRLISSAEGIRYIRLFDKICPNTNISKLKKIDFIIWQKRKI